MTAGSGRGRLREADPAPGLMTLHAEPLYFAVRLAFVEHPEVRVWTRDHPKGCTGVYCERTWREMRRPVPADLQRTISHNYISGELEFPELTEPRIEVVPGKVIAGRQVFSNYEIDMLQDWQLERVGDWLLREMRGLAKGYGREL